MKPLDQTSRPCYTILIPSLEQNIRVFIKKPLPVAVFFMISLVVANYLYPTHAYQPKIDTPPSVSQNTSDLAASLQGLVVGKNIITANAAGSQDTTSSINQPPSLKINNFPPGALTALPDQSITPQASLLPTSR